MCSANWSIVEFVSAMQALNDLRQAARDRRDKLIAKARAEYEATLSKIASIEQDLLGREPTNPRSIASCVSSVIPRDETFTSADVVRRLEALDPRRPWRKRSVDHTIQRLRSKGFVRRLSKAKRGTNHAEPAVYVRAGAQTDSHPFAEMTLADVLYATLEGKSLTTTELIVTIREAGYRSTMSHKRLRDHVAGHAERRKVSARWRALGVLLLIHFVVLPIATKVFARGIVEKAQASIVRHVENISIDDSRENKQFRSTRRYGGNRLFIPIAPGGYAGEFVDGIRCDSFVPWRKIRPPIKQLFNVGIKIVGTCWHCLQTDDMPFKDCRSLSGVSDTDVDSDLLSWNERIDTPSFNRKPRSLIQSHLIGSLLNGSLRSLGASLCSVGGDTGEPETVVHVPDLRGVDQKLNDGRARQHGGEQRNRLVPPVVRRFFIFLAR